MQLHPILCYVYHFYGFATGCLRADINNTFFNYFISNAYVHTHTETQSIKCISVFAVGNNERYQRWNRAPRRVSHSDFR